MILQWVVDILASKKTLVRIKQRFWWPSLKTSVEYLIANCDRLAAKSTAGIKQKAELQTFSVHGAFRTMAADILGPVTLAKKSRAWYILVMSDLFTKYAVTVELQGMTAATVANARIDERIMKFRAPDVIQTDRGSNFNKELMQDICRIFMIEKTRTTPYNPQGNGQVERFKRVIADTLSKYCAEKLQEWDVYLPYITFVWSNAHWSNASSPFVPIRRTIERITNGSFWPILFHKCRGTRHRNRNRLAIHSRSSHHSLADQISEQSL